SSQAIIGAVLGLAIAKGARGVRFRVLGRIASGWITAPIIAGILSLVALFFAQNLFEQQVVQKEPQSAPVHTMQNFHQPDFDLNAVISVAENQFRISA
ncbi:MAG: inorganic phosphate transporter, partial [Gammaproteobacteria bacterium]|nr:inorganic phosphate transporter [Gammaproteobacteria bacterium]NIR92448.1 inorganic phosphate transporter [Gammaproteobacteria bacterium]NIW97172.1 inorganic phosphate transporter [Phycisphaerae bacterium]